jgi:hypothetical protein
MKTQHTPTPWKRDDLCEPNLDGIIMRVGEIPISGNGRSFSLNNAENAAYLIRAVNSHESLIETLRQALAAFQILGSGQKPGYSMAEYCDMIGDAISQAEGGV